MIRILNESEELNTKFNEEKNIYKKVDIMKEFGKEIPNMDQQLWSEFIESNPSALLNEFSKYKFSINNPFIQFINTYFIKNKNLNPFIGDNSKYNIIHDLIYNSILDTKQIAFKAFSNDDYDYQIEILLNPTLWKNSDKDIVWLVKLWDWFNNKEDLLKHINNKNIVKIFNTDESKKTDTNTLTYSPKLDLKELRRLKVATFFTDIIDRLFKLKSKDLTPELEEKFKHEVKSLDSKIRVKTNPLKSPNLIGEQVKEFSEYVNSSDHDVVTGRYREQDSIENDRHENSDNKKDIKKELSSREKDDLLFNLRSIPDLLKNLKTLAGDLNAKQWDKLIKLLMDSQDSFRKGDLDI